MCYSNFVIIFFSISVKRRREGIRCVGVCTVVWMAETRLKKGAVYFKPLWFGSQAFGIQTQLSEVVPGVANTYSKAFVSHLHLCVL